MDADVLVLLDADFQHDQDQILLLIIPIVEDGYDLVINVITGLIFGSEVE